MPWLWLRSMSHDWHALTAISQEHPETGPLLRDVVVDRDGVERHGGGESGQAPISDPDIAGGELQHAVHRR